jgi:energy-coupling factor transport system substrate-specific component
MHELLSVWTGKKGLKLIAAHALVYALLLIPFNQLQWVVAGIPVRPAAAIPVVCGILFGPAAAWGLGIGNIAGDLFGSWSQMSIVGFFINMAYPYFAYRLWHALVKNREAVIDQYMMFSFWFVTIVATFLSMFLLAGAGTFFFGRPFESKFIGYYTNSIVLAMLAGALLFYVIYPWAVKRDLVYGKKWDEKSMKW